MVLKKSRSQRIIVPMRITIYFLHSEKQVRYYNSALMKEEPILAREHAMLEGAIVEGDHEFTGTPSSG